MTIPKSDHWGPFAPDLDPAELRARLRAMRALTRVLTGPRGAELSGLLMMAENDNRALAPALAALDKLAPLDRRSILGAYAGLAR
jgi:hypothetical protein